MNDETQRSQIRAQIEGQLPTRAQAIWNTFNPQKPLPSENLVVIVRETLQQFDKRAPLLASSIELAVSQAFHPFPFMLHYPASSSNIETELHHFAHDNREKTLRSWMACLLNTTRNYIEATLDYLLNKKATSGSKTKRRLNLCETLSIFNFYNDAFCYQVAAELKSYGRTPQSLEMLRAKAKADLTAVLEWPDLSFEQVLHDFALRTGWK